MMQTDAHPSMEQCRSHTVTLTLIITHQPDATALTAQIKGWRRMGPAGSLSGKKYILLVLCQKTGNVRTR